MSDPYVGEAGGFYSPTPKPWQARPDLQRWLNSTNGLLSIQIQDSIYNLLTAAPGLHAENLLLAGEDVIWLRRLTSGQKCPNWNYQSDQCGESKCTQCFGTGIYQGFASPIQLKFSFIPGRADVLIEQAGLTVTQKPTAWTIATGINIAERDMVVTYLNERYLIHAAEGVEKQGRRVYQALTLSRIDKTDVLYYLPVPGVMGDGQEDFTASICIRPPSTDFFATINIRNYYFNEVSDGITPLEPGIGLHLGTAINLANGAIND